MEPSPPRRTVHTGDALAWLRAHDVLTGCSLVTSLPDLSEVRALGLDLDGWRAWFVDAAALVLSRCPDDGVAIFFQSDIRVAGRWIDKGFLCQLAAERTGHVLRWHRIVCRAPAGTASFGRPSYSHLLCFGRTPSDARDPGTPDVLPDAGEVTWTRGMGTRACLAACHYIRAHTPTRTVVDPFCGHGTVLAVANALGLDAIGVELGARRARQARTLEATAEGALRLR